MKNPERAPIIRKAFEDYATGMYMGLANYSTQEFYVQANLATASSRYGYHTIFHEIGHLLLYQVDRWDGTYEYKCTTPVAPMMAVGGLRDGWEQLTGWQKDQLAYMALVHP